MKARTKRRITETVVGLFSVAAVVLTFKIFVIPATRGEKVRLRFTLVNPDTMGGETIRTGSGGLEPSKPPHRGARSGIPAALAGLRLPSDPDELPDVLISRRISIFRILERACPADHEWVRRALSALEHRAESDTLVRKELRRSYGSRVLSGEICASDLDGFEAWLRRQLRRGWEDGLLGDSAAPGHYGLLMYLSTSDDAASREVVQGIAKDGTVAHYWRDLAARFMVEQHYGSVPDGTDPRYMEVVQSVLLDLAASAPPLPELERYHLQWLDMVLDPDDPFFTEYEDVFRHVGRPLPEWWSRRGGKAIARGPKSEGAGVVRTDSCVSAPARQLSDSGLVSNMMTRYRPDGTKRDGVGGTAVLHLKVDVGGRVTQAEIAESSGHRGLDTASVWTARWIRFEPAVSCGSPIDAEITYTLRWAEWNRGDS